MSHPFNGRLNILVLFDQNALHANTTRDHVQCFGQFSSHAVYYAHATQGAPVTFPFDSFDVVIIHYSVRLAYDWHISPPFAKAIKEFSGLKVLFIQDEYDGTWQANKWINELGIRCVFTNVPEAYRKNIYARVDHDLVEFFPTLTGYVPINMGTRHKPKALTGRRLMIGYRVRRLPFAYGKLGWDKFVLAVRMRAECRKRAIPHDIEWEDSKRIYGEAWYNFLSGCRATLGSETGSNVFDFDGKLRPALETAAADDPTLTFDQFFARHLKDVETSEIMNHISPRIFEAVALRTGLVLFEGRYCDIVKPDIHYIPLRKDFSNIEEVLSKLNNDDYVASMIEHAYTDLIQSGRYSYPTFVREVEAVIEARVQKPKGVQLLSRVVGVLTPYRDPEAVVETALLSAPIHSGQLFDLRGSVHCLAPGVRAASKALAVAVWHAGLRRTLAATQWLRSGLSATMRLLSKAARRIARALRAIGQTVARSAVTRLRVGIGRGNQTSAAPPGSIVSGRLDARDEFACRTWSDRAPSCLTEVITEPVGQERQKGPTSPG